ncbi:MAG TPA: family 2 glycosyl transferase [Phycisphaerales bacterium]|nr:family 2 glycosyl transferase [Phycisphaerales bacterium]
MSAIVTQLGKTQTQSHNPSYRRCYEGGALMEQATPYFSVIMPAFNRQQLIEVSVGSVLNQTFGDFELIVIDDGSTDNTVQILEQINDPRLIVLKQTNAGPGAARNRGIGVAKGEYVAFLDSDDLYLPWTLQIYHDAILANENPSLMISHASDFHDTTELEQIKNEPVKIHRYDDYFQAADQNFWIGASVVGVNREVLLKSGGFNNAKVNQEDCDLWLRLGNAPGFIAIHQPICSGRRWHDQNVSHEMDKNIKGVQYLLNQAKLGAYPKTNHKALLTILTRHIRPASLDCIKHGYRSVAWDLYKETFFWNLKLGRLRYLLGFWLRFITGRRGR